MRAAAVVRHDEARLRTLDMKLDMKPPPLLQLRYEALRPHTAMRCYDSLFFPRGTPISSDAFSKRALFILSDLER